MNDQRDYAEERCPACDASPCIGRECEAVTNQQGRTKMDQKVFAKIRRGLNAHHGASSAGCYAVVDTVSGHVFEHLFTPGERPSLPARQILVCVGGYFSFGTLRSVLAIAGVSA